MDLTVELLKEPAPAVPHDVTVIVLCDRGISSPKRWAQIPAQGWHPRIRCRKNIDFNPPTDQLRCTLLAVWYAGQESWIIPPTCLSW